MGKSRNIPREADAEVAKEAGLATQSNNVEDSEGVGKVVIKTSRGKKRKSDKVEVKKERKIIKFRQNEPHFFLNEGLNTICKAHNMSIIFFKLIHEDVGDADDDDDDDDHGHIAFESDTAKFNAEDLQKLLNGLKSHFVNLVSSKLYTFFLDFFTFFTFIFNSVFSRKQKTKKKILNQM